MKSAKARADAFDARPAGKFHVEIGRTNFLVRRDPDERAGLQLFVCVIAAP
jgi:hypothetical protein